MRRHENREEYVRGARAFHLRVIPVVFRTPRSLAALNVAAVGLAIAAMTTAAFTVGEPRTHWSIIVGLPSLAVGLVWAAMLRKRETIGHSQFPLGWALSIPLAAVNGAVACGLLFASESHELGSFFGGLFLGATFGVVLWAPGLLLVILLFGLPIAHAQKLAKRGLAGEERGEQFVGIACVVVAALAVALARSSSFLFDAYAFLAAATGIIATHVAHKRESARRRFVERVEANEVPGLRVEARTLGKVLVRIENTVETYRVAPQPDEELIELDDDGRALRAMRP